MADENEPWVIHYSADEIERLLEQRQDFLTASYDKASTYDTVVTLGGYGAFFALWSAVANDVTQAARLTTVVLMGFSILTYISWHVAIMIARHWHDRRFAASARKAQDAESAFSEWEQIERDQQSTMRIVQQRFWIPVFGGSVASGVAGASVLIYNCAAVVFGWPQLTGQW